MSKTLAELTIDKGKFTCLAIALEFKLQDCWIGAYWQWQKESKSWDVWLCLIPCLPIHFYYRRYPSY